MTITRDAGFGTLAIHAGQAPDPTTGAVMTPVYLTSTYAQESPGKHRGFEYSRTQNPTRFALQDCVAALEGGTHGFAFASGCAALSTLLHVLRSGDHVLCSDDLYGGTFRIFDKVFRQLGLEFSYVDMTDLGATEAALRPATRLVWIETPTNPMLKVVDVRAVAALAHAHARGAKVGVDNTFMSPYFQRPLALGADVVLHSGTKYLNGHSDVVCGLLVTSDGALAERLAFFQNAVGAVLPPMDSFLVLRGLKTLHVRMQRHAENATALARWLERHPKVERVIYPGLESHPQHALAARQTSGPGGMITFFPRGDLAACRRFLEACRVFTLAESLGGVESLVDHPAIMTHASIPAETRAALGITDNLVRLSVGIEDLRDLQADLERALSAV
ncbi:cystathionine gamma-synthase [Anaeromyxobacter oryzae]|uniref:Cystathionine gamma-synthase n=1 Tax=Anaeromyxobacter oryzae TaxID=2918170 RepID=A0ABM7WWB6_9BACT|nr:cystathionine gamma-synthase [Anaeromyxobacter oryzae]BDG03719.1 cystathionine gamma-synthase [Anaeromyxobacter oryzae]